MSKSQAFIPLHAYQERWLSDSSRFKIGMFSRQSGKSFVATLEILLDILEARTQGYSSDWLIFSPTHRQAIYALEHGFLRHLETFNHYFEQSGQQPLKIVRRNKEGVILCGGTQVFSLPGNESTVRGYSSNVLLDEFAFHRDGEAVWRSVFPIITAGHKIRVMSTPNGYNNRFFRLMSDKSGLWSKHICDIYQAVAEGLAQDITALKSAIGDPSAWAQEYELRFDTVGLRIFDVALVRAAQSPEAGLPERYTGGHCYMGVDVALRNDCFVIVVLERCHERLWLREMLVERGISFAKQYQLIDIFMKRYRVVRMNIDQGGMGEAVFEHCQQHYGKHRVFGVLMNPKIKEKQTYHTKALLEEDQISIPQDDALLQDFLNYKKELSSTGRVIFRSPRNKSGHGDRLSALMLALDAAKHVEVAYHFEGIKTPPMQRF